MGTSYNTNTNKLISEWPSTQVNATRIVEGFLKESNVQGVDSMTPTQKLAAFHQLLTMHIKGLARNYEKRAAADAAAISAGNALDALPFE